MRMLEFFRSSAVRVALAFVLVTTVATTAVFGLVYFRIGEANEARNRLILETEAAKSVNRSVEELRGAFEVRLTNDLRRIDYAALFDADHKFMFGNIETLPSIPSFTISASACMYASRERAASAGEATFSPRWSRVTAMPSVLMR